MPCFHNCNNAPYHRDRSKLITWTLSANEGMWVHPWKSRKKDFEIKLTKKVNQVGQYFSWVSRHQINGSAHGGHAQFPAKNKIGK